jgi:hypothetical protein
LRLARRGFALGRQRVETTARAILAGGDCGIFPPAHQQTHFFESSECAVKGAVRRQQAALLDIGEVSRDFVAVEVGHAVAMEIGGADANRDFERDQTTWLSSHTRILSRYMLIRQSPIRDAGRASPQHATRATNLRGASAAVCC